MRSRTAGSASTGMYRGLRLWAAAVREAGTLDQDRVIDALDHALAPERLQPRVERLADGAEFRVSGVAQRQHAEFDAVETRGALAHQLLIGARGARGRRGPHATSGRAGGRICRFVAAADLRHAHGAGHRHATHRRYKNFDDRPKVILGRNVVRIGQINRALLRDIIIKLIINQAPFRYSLKLGFITKMNLIRFDNIEDQTVDKIFT